MVLIDGMPIVSSLSTVYGLSGIPNALIERVEIVKGPASSLYGSEAVGGLINIITKNTAHAARLYADYMHTSWNEKSADLGFVWKPAKKTAVLTGLNGYLYDQPIDKNKDGFTDVTLQKRLSVFQKWSVTRKENRLLSFAARYYHEDRWGGDMRWNKSFRGGDSIYGEVFIPTDGNSPVNISYQQKRKYCMRFPTIRISRIAVMVLLLILPTSKFCFINLPGIKKQGCMIC